MKQIVYEVSAQINYASAEYNEFDENVHSYDTPMRSSFQISFTSFSKDIQIMIFSSSSSRDSSSVNFIVCEIDELSMKNRSISSDAFSLADSKSAQVFYDEGFASNKRPHMNNQTQQSNSEEYQFQSQMNKQKRKEIKKIKKRAKLISLVRMFDDAIETYDKSIFIRKLLKKNKIDISMMNLLT